MALPFLMALLSMGTTLSGIRSQNQALTSQAQQMAAGAIRQTQSDLDLLELRKSQVSTTITLEQVRRMRQGQRERSTLAARLADAGVAGGTTVRDAVASVIQEETDLATLETKKEWNVNQLLMEQREAVTRGQSQINQAQGLLSQRTQAGPGVLQLIGAGLSGYSTGKQLEPMFVGPKTNRVKAGEPGVDAQGFWV